MLHGAGSKVGTGEPLATSDRAKSGDTEAMVSITAAKISRVMRRWRVRWLNGRTDLGWGIVSALDHMVPNRRVRAGLSSQ